MDIAERPSATLHCWEATCRCDEEEVFCTETLRYQLPTSDLAEAARLIVQDLGGHATLLALRRTDV